MKYTLGTAAKATGKAKSTILQSIKEGRISAFKNDLGAYEIDPSELHRIYPPVQAEQFGDEKIKRDTTAPEHQENTLKMALLAQENEFLRQTVEKLEIERDKWHDQAARLLLIHQPEAAKPEQKKEPPEVAMKQNQSRLVRFLTMKIW